MTDTALEMFHRTEEWFVRFFSTEGVGYDLSVEFVGSLLFLILGTGFYRIILLILGSRRPKERETILHSVLSDMLTSLDKLGAQPFERNDMQELRNWRDFGILGSLGKKMEMTAGEFGSRQNDIRKVAGKILLFAENQDNLGRRGAKSAFKLEVNKLVLELANLSSEVFLHRKYHNEIRKHANEISERIDADVLSDTPKTDKAAKADKLAQADAVDHEDQTETVDQADQAEAVDQVEGIDQTDQTGTVDQADQADENTAADTEESTTTDEA